MLAALFCVCLASIAFSAPMPLPLSGKPSENCMGQHRILMKGCNLNHGFYFFKYVYSFSTRRNQTQVKKEEASTHNNISQHQPSEEEEVARRLVEDGGAGRGGGDNESALPERAGPEHGSTVEDGRPPSTAVNAGSEEAHGPGPEAGDTSLALGAEGSGDFHFQDKAESSILVPSQRPVTALREHEGSREAAGGAGWEGDGLGELEAAGERNDSRAGEAVGGSHEAEQAWEMVTTGRGPAEDAATGAEEEGSGHVSMLGTAQGSDRGQTTVGGGAALTSITENTEDVEVDADSMGEYAYIPDAGAVTITQGATQAERTSLVQIPTKADDEVNIFIGKANIHVGEQGMATVGPGDNGHDGGMALAGAGSQLPTLVASKERDSGQRSAVSGQDAGEAEGAPITVGRDDRQEERELASIAVQQEGRNAATSPRPDEGDCTTLSGEAARLPGSRRRRPPAPSQRKGGGLPAPSRGKEKGSTGRGREDSGGEARAVGRAQVMEGTEAAAGDSGEPAGPRAPTRAPLSVGAAARGAAPGPGAAPTAPRQGKGRGGGGGRPGGQQAARGLARVFEAFGRSRRVEQVRRADELRVRERSVYAAGRAAPAGARPRHRAPVGPHASRGAWPRAARRGSEDSSQSSELDQGSRSDSRQEGGGSWRREGRWRH